MLSKTFRNKRITVAALTSLLLVSFCLIPCGKSGLITAEAKTHAEMGHDMGGGMKGHSCHDSASADVQLKAGDHGGCLHCDLSNPGIIQTANTGFSDQVAAVETVYTVSLSSLSSSYLNWATLRPPGPDRPIHLLNSIFII